MSSRTVTPLLVSRGGCAVNQKSRSHLIPRRRGGRSQAVFQNAFRSRSCERPPRPLHQRKLRGIFLMSRPPLLTRREINPLPIFLLTVAFSFSLLPTAHAQQPFAIKIDTQLVVETVFVKDRDGRAIEGLTEKDFTVSEDKAPQTIRVFEFQKLDDATAPMPAAEPVNAP